jgi:hypothetical protein
MTQHTSPSLKQRNQGLLVSFALIDALAIASLVFYPQMATFQLSHTLAIRQFLIPLLPVAVWLLIDVVPSDIKAVLVFWRLHDVLPGHRAFTHYAAHDSRVDLAALQDKLGELPTDSTKQNAVWFKLYKQVQDNAEILESHKSYLLWRDATAFSAVLLVAAPLGLYGLIHSTHTAITSATLFTVQYIACALAGRNRGIRFVCNVVSSYIHQAPAQTQKATRKKPST